MSDHRHDGLGVGLAQTNTRTDRGTNEIDAGVGVISRVSLADVVQQRSKHQEIRARHPIDEHRGVGRCLPQMSVDSEAVIGVSLRSSLNRLPLGQHAGDQPALIESL